LGAGLGRQRPPASSTAEDDGGRRWSLGSSELGVRPGQREGGEATGGPSGSTGSAGWRLRDRRVELHVATHGSSGGSARAPCTRGEGGRLLKANKGGGAALRAKTMVVVWGAARQGTATTWGGYGRDASGRPTAWSARRGHGARDTWVQGTGCGWWCGARGGVHGARTGGPSTAAAQLDARRRRAWAQSAPKEFRLAMFDCQKLNFSKHKWTK
jgi:hypothetical protein